MRQFEIIEYAKAIDGEPRTAELRQQATAKLNGDALPVFALVARETRLIEAFLHFIAEGTCESVSRLLDQIDALSGIQQIEGFDYATLVAGFANLGFEIQDGQGAYRHDEYGESDTTAFTIRKGLDTATYTRIH